MKAEKLMIGDWVKYIDITPSEVVAIDGTATCRIRTLMSNRIDEFGNKDYKAITTRIEDIKPIPLTADILEKNGWKKNGRPYEWEDNIWVQRWNLPIDKGYFQINDCPKYDGFTWNNVELKFVHTLQHALRLCGLDNLADNFKI